MTKTTPLQLCGTFHRRTMTIFGFPKTLWSGMLLLSLMYAIERTPQAQGRKLSCYKCHSQTSWEDCERKMYAVECERHEDECYTIQFTKRVITNTTVTQIVTYARGCNTPEGCSYEECRENNWECILDCCDTHFCNASVLMSENFLFIVISLRLALEVIFNF